MSDEDQPVNRRNTASFSGVRAAKRSANGFHLHQSKSWSGRVSSTNAMHREASAMKEMRTCETCFRSYHFYSSGQSPWNPDDSAAAGMSHSVGKASSIWVVYSSFYCNYVNVEISLSFGFYIVVSSNSNRNVKRALGLGLGLEELEWDFEHRQSMLSFKEDVERASLAGFPLFLILFVL